MENTKGLAISKSKQTIYFSMVFIALGVVFINTSSVTSIGIVFIAIGGLFFISGMAANKKVRHSNE